MPTKFNTVTVNNNNNNSKKVANHNNNQQQHEEKVEMKNKTKQVQINSTPTAVVEVVPDSNPVSENVIRFIKKDPLEKYEVIKVLGEGSIGAVSCVRMKPEAVGGSAYHAPGGETDVGCFSWLCGGGRNNKKNNKNNNNTNKKHNRNKSNTPVHDRKLKNVLYAMKSIQIRRINDEYLDELRNEISILQSMDHPNIVKAYEVYEWKGQIFVIMEHCSGGDLYTRKPYSEKEACQIIEKLCSAIAYMHDNKITHRDLKFENIMFDSPEKESPKKDMSEIKVIDFGLSTKFTPGEKLTEGVGTIYTMAPQVLQGIYTSKADMWSIGVITYLLLSGQKPFYHKKRRRVIDQIMRCNYNFYAPIWSRISSEAKDFIRHLIEIDPKKRMTARQALQHPWLSSSSNLLLSNKKPSSLLMKDVENNIYKFAQTNEFKKLALMVVAHRSAPEETRQLRQAFNQYDTTNTGTIGLEEFKMVIKNYDNSRDTDTKTPNLSEKELEETFHALDINNNGVILYTEFLAATLETAGNIEEERLANAFDQLDRDDSGFISKKNLTEMLGQTYTSTYIDELINEVDLDNDGKISFNEFLHACRRRRSMEEGYDLQKMESKESERNGDDSDLADVDTFVPGGKYDTSTNRLSE